MVRIRVVTWNIHKGFGSTSRIPSLRGIRSALHELDCDVVLMQEVLGRHDRHAARHAGWPAETQANYLASGVWAHVAYAQNAAYAHGHHGNAVLSKFPIFAWENHDVSNTRWERRGVLHARLRCADSQRPLHVLCTHLDLLHRGRVRQIERIVAHIRQEIPADEPLLLAGDFNDWGQRLGRILADELGLVEAHGEMHGGPGRSFPAGLPVLQLDRLYVRGLRVHAAEVLKGVRWHRLSDHAPVMVDVAWT